MEDGLELRALVNPATPPPARLELSFTAATATWEGSSRADSPAVAVRLVLVAEERASASRSSGSGKLVAGAGKETVLLGLAAHGCPA